MSRDWVISGLLVTLVLCLCGCKEEMKGGPRVEIIPITGKVLVDGKPAKVWVDFVQVSENKVEFAVPEAQGGTDEEGVISVSSYVSNDGSAPGEYKLLFGMPNRENPITGELGGDAFRGKYSKVATCEITVTIPEDPEDTPYDIGTFELTTD